MGLLKVQMMSLPQSGNCGKF